MKINIKVLLLTPIFLALFFASLLLIRFSLPIISSGVSEHFSDYVEVTEDRGNICSYDSNGELTGSSLAMGRNVDIKVPKKDYEQYKKNAIASNKCFQ